MRVKCPLILGLAVVVAAGIATPDRSPAKEATQKTVAKNAAKENPEKKPPAKSDGPRKKLAVKAFMRGKLDAMQDILEGLTTEDLDKVRGGADRLRVMSMRTEWNVEKSAEYRRLSATFRRSAKALGDAARKNRPDSAALANLRVTFSCVNCHKHIRSGNAGPQ